ncbi:MAG: cytochrome P460 family protein [Pseudomonadota bacterium]
MRILAITAALAIAIGATASALEDRTLVLPTDYKTSFDNYLISDRLGQDDQVISLYANATARESAKTGTLADGSVIVGELYGVAKDANGEVIESPVGRRIPTELKAIVVMERQAAWADQYSDALKLGGWEFEVFSPDGKNLGKDTTACRECHAPLGDTDFTWTISHMAGAN